MTGAGAPAGQAGPTGLTALVVDDLLEAGEAEHDVALDRQAGDAPDGRQLRVRATEDVHALERGRLGRAGR